MNIDDITCEICGDVCNVNWHKGVMVDYCPSCGWERKVKLKSARELASEFGMKELSNENYKKNKFIAGLRSRRKK